MLQKFQKRKLPDDISSTTSTKENADLDENDQRAPKKDIKPVITIEKIRHKTDVYARELAHRAERYEKTQAISKFCICYTKLHKKID